MSALAVILLVITSLFTLLLVLKQYFRELKLCAICLAVTLTWLSLLLLHWLDMFDNGILIAILMGQSSLGIYYLLEKHAPKDTLVFRLPVLITLIYVVFSALTLSLPLDALVIIASIWAGVGSLFVFRTKPQLKNKVKALIECCSNW